MIIKSVTCGLAAGLLLAGAAQAQSGAPEANGVAAGGIAGVKTLPDGRTVATLGRKSKTCKAGQMPIATGARTKVTTVKGTKIYPKGLVACLDPADFGGSSAMSIEGDEVVLKPAPPSGTA